jgi:hypothetical protein
MIENEEASKHRDGKFVFKMIKNINVVFGKPVKGKKRKKNENDPKDSSTVTHENRVVSSVITAAWVNATRPSLPPGSTPLGRCHRAREPRRPPSRHHRWVHAARPSPPSGPRLPDCLHLQQFGKSSPSLFPSPSVNSVLLCLDVCLYDYASKLIMLRNLIVQMPMIIFMFLLI